VVKREAARNPAEQLRKFLQDRREAQA